MNVLTLIKTSWQQLKGQYGIALLASLPVSLLPTTIYYQQLIGMLLILVFSGPLRVGLSKFFIALTQKKQPLLLPTIFEGFYCFKNALGVFLFSLVLIFGGLLLFVIPGILVFIWLSQSYFILAEEPNLEPIEVLKKSKQLIKGKEVLYFLTTISFGLISLLLFYFKLSLLNFFILPFQYLFFANFYNILKNN